MLYRVVSLLAGPPFSLSTNKSHLFLLGPLPSFRHHSDHQSGCRPGLGVDHGGAFTHPFYIFCSFETQPFSRLRVVEIPISAVVVAHLLAGEDGSSWEEREEIHTLLSGGGDIRHDALEKKASCMVFGQASLLHILFFLGHLGCCRLHALPCIVWWLMISA